MFKYSISCLEDKVCELKSKRAYLGKKGVSCDGSSESNRAISDIFGVEGNLQELYDAIRILKDLDAEFSE